VRAKLLWQAGEEVEAHSPASPAAMVAHGKIFRELDCEE
jgi:hypothetical protein